MADDNRTIEKKLHWRVGRWRVNLRCWTKLYDHLHWPVVNIIVGDISFKFSHAL